MTEENREFSDLKLERKHVINVERPGLTVNISGQALEQ